MKDKRKMRVVENKKKKGGVKWLLEKMKEKLEIEGR